MNALLNDLLTILNEVHTQLEDGVLELDGINANNVEYMAEVVRRGRESTETGAGARMGATH